MNRFLKYSLKCLRFTTSSAPLPEWLVGGVDGGGEEGGEGGQGGAGGRQVEHEQAGGQVGQHQHPQQQAPAPGGHQRQGAAFIGLTKKYFLHLWIVTKNIVGFCKVFK